MDSTEEIILIMDLEKRLMPLDYNKLGLKNLEPLRLEVSKRKEKMISDGSISFPQYLEAL